MNYAPVNPLEMFGNHISFSPWMIWAFFIAFLIVYSTFSIILLYHWIAYGMRARGVLVAEVLFPLVSMFLIYAAMIGISTM